MPSAPRGPDSWQRCTGLGLLVTYQLGDPGHLGLHLPCFEGGLSSFPLRQAASRLHKDQKCSSHSGVAQGLSFPTLPM